MTDYRAVARHVRYWRGTVHKWSTVWPLTGSVSAGNYGALVTQIKDLEVSVCWGSGVAADGGVYEVLLYDQSSGGVPISSSTYFDPDNPATWIPYIAGGWTSTFTSGLAPAEVALQVEWPAGLSASGKPVIFRKWFHSVPNSTAVPPAVDVAAADVTSLENTIEGIFGTIGGLGALLGNSRRLAATTPAVLAFYGNHQMPRGRRRPKAA